MENNCKPDKIQKNHPKALENEQKKQANSGDRLKLRRRKWHKVSSHFYGF